MSLIAVPEPIGATIGGAIGDYQKRYDRRSDRATIRSAMIGGAIERLCERLPYPSAVSPSRSLMAGPDFVWQYCVHATKHYHAQACVKNPIEHEVAIDRPKALP